MSHSCCPILTQTPGYLAIIPFFFKSSDFTVTLTNICRVSFVHEILLNVH